MKLDGAMDRASIATLLTKHIDDNELNKIQELNKNN
jgi:hypothetical protein